MPQGPQITLTQANLFILPTTRGLVALAVLVALFLLGSNYQNNFVLLLCYWLVAMMIVALHQSHRCLSGLQLHAKAGPDVFAQENAYWRVSVNRTGDYPISFSFAEQAEQLVNQFPAMVHYATTQRGLIERPWLRIASEAPFGLFVVWTWWRLPDEVLVYPKPIAGPVKHLLLSQGQQQGCHETQISAGGDQLAALVPYRAGEPQSRIAWRLVAQGRGMYSKQMESADSALYLSAVNHSEAALSALCYELLQARSRKRALGLQLAGKIFAPNQQEAHWQQCLRWLALCPLT